MHNSD